MVSFYIPSGLDPNNKTPPLSNDHIFDLSHNTCILVCIGSNIGAIVGGVIGGIVLVVVVIVIIILVVCIMKRKGNSKYELSKTSQMEMGSSEPSKPILGGTCASLSPSLPPSHTHMHIHKLSHRRKLVIKQVSYQWNVIWECRTTPVLPVDQNRTPK